MEDGSDRAFRNAGFAVNAFIRIDEEHLRTFIETVDRTNHNAICVLAIKARLGDDVSHSPCSYDNA
jgi:hypothetical protein